ncbi:hypothetical protein BDQ17DRAFT_1437966 [Cyathus striatus]|nr:hypothetical protein BDQ17DRAFT_1437966 [Cyathus striatus]
MSVFTVYVHDASNERKSAENLKKLIYYVKNIIENKWGLTVIALTSDGSGESSKARKDVVREYPELIGPDCYAHQIALVSGKYFQHDATTPQLTYSDKARSLNISKASTYSHLLELKLPLEALVDNENEEMDPNNCCIMIGNWAAKQKGQAMMDIIEDSLFWHSLARIKKHLEPLAHASCIMQDAHAHLNQVPLIFGTLMCEYVKMAEMDGDNDGLIQAIIDSIEKRWGKCNQEAFILAILLHPSLKTTPFAQNLPQLVPASPWHFLQ